MGVICGQLVVAVGLTLGVSAGVEATGEVTSPPAPGNGTVSTTESSSVTLRFPPEGGSVTGEVRVVYRVEFTEVFCEQRATFLFALTGRFDAAADTMQGDAQEGGSTVVVAGCAGLTTNRTGSTTPWTASLDRATGEIAGRLEGGAPVDFVALADPAALAPDEPEPTVPTQAPAEDPVEETTPTAVGGSGGSDDSAGRSALPFLLGGGLLAAGGYGVYRIWPRPDLSLAEIHRLLGQAREGAETVDPADRTRWKHAVVTPIAQIARRMPEEAAPYRDDVHRLRDETSNRGERPHRSLSEESAHGGSGSGNTESYAPPPFVAQDIGELEEKVSLDPSFKEVIL